MKTILLIIALAALGLAQEKPIVQQGGDGAVNIIGSGNTVGKPAPKDQTIEMSREAKGKLEIAELKAENAQLKYQNFHNALLQWIKEKSGWSKQYKDLEQASIDATEAMNKATDAERKSAKADGYEPDIKAGVWRKKVEAAEAQ